MPMLSREKQQDLNGFNVLQKRGMVLPGDRWWASASGTAQKHSLKTELDELEREMEASSLRSKKPREKEDSHSVRHGQ